jgi:hypothetical protein
MNAMIRGTEMAVYPKFGLSCWTEEGRERQQKQRDEYGKRAGGERNGDGQDHQGGCMTLENDMKELIEQMADLEHEQWAHWTCYMLTVLCKDHPELNKDENILRWSRQINVKYKDLSEKEKESDREWARKSFDIARDFAEYL